jgi:uncharacterized protein (DUF1697 family)
MATHALLLRGINVGKARQLPMAELRELMTELGYGDVRTYLRTGNIVLSTSHDRTRLVSTVEEGIKGHFGMPVPVVVRSRAQIGRIVAANPLPHGVAEPSKLFVAFLDQPLSAGAVDAVDPDDYLPDEFRVSDAEVYFRCPDGLANSTLTPAFWKKVGADDKATVRNWNTVLMLQRMLET